MTGKTKGDFANLAKSPGEGPAKRFTLHSSEISGMPERTIQRSVARIKALGEDPEADADLVPAPDDKPEVRREKAIERHAREVASKQSADTCWHKQKGLLMVNYPLIRNLRLRDQTYSAVHAPHVATFDAKLTSDIGARDIKLLRNDDGYYSILAYAVGQKGFPRLTLRDGTMRDVLTDRAAAAYEAAAAEAGTGGEH